MNLGYLSQISEYVNIYNYGLAYQTVYENVFNPLLAGVNGEADNKDLAKEFICFIIGGEEQESFLERGFETYLPINKAAFHTMTEKPEEEELATPTMEDSIVINAVIYGFCVL